MPRYWILAGAGLAALTGLLFLFLSSPWLTWELMPQAEIRILADTSLPLFAQQWQAIRSYVPPTAAVHVGSAFDRLRYAVDHWSWPAAGRALRIITSSPRPLWPVAVVQLDTVLAEPILAIAVADGTQTRWLLVEHAAQLHDRPLPARTETYEWSSAADMAVVVPGETVRYLPATLRESWNTLLRDRLAFRHTKPLIVEALTEFDRLYIYSEGDALAVGVMGSEDDRQRWQAQVEEWVIDEERYGRPVQQAFRLPDGTIGRELVPGLPGEVFQDPDGQGCRSPLPDKTPLWLCSAATHTAVATGSELAMKQPIIPDHQWLAALQGPWLASLPIDRIIARGLPSRATILTQAFAQ